MQAAVKMQRGCKITGYFLYLMGQDWLHLRTLSLLIPSVRNRVPSLEFRDFFCERGGYPLFQPISFSVKAGEVVQVAGPNGAGKTTLLRAVCGLFAEWQGAFIWSGRNLRVPDYDMCSAMLYLGHQPGIKKALTARENLEWYFGIQGLRFPGDVSDALRRVGLAGYEDVPCHQMSAGQMRRVALARLFVAAAPVWILDEPFTAIDRQGISELEGRIEHHVSEGGLVLLTTHQPLGLAQFKMVELQPAVEQLL